MAFGRRVKEEASCQGFTTENQQRPYEVSIIQHWGLLSGTPPDARGPQAGRSAASAHPAGFPPRPPDRPCTRSPWATRVLSVGPETRSRPGAESSEPHFLLAGRGVGGEHFLLCTDSRGDVIAGSSFGQPPRGQRSAVGRAGARSQERAPRLPTLPCAPPGLQSAATWRPALHRGSPPPRKKRLAPSEAEDALSPPRSWLQFAYQESFAASKVVCHPPLKPHFLSLELIP